MLRPSVRLNAAALTPSRARLSRDLGERWCLEAEEEGGDYSRETEEEEEASREEGGDLQEREDLREDEEKADEEQMREGVYEDGDAGSPE